MCLESRPETHLARGLRVRNRNVTPTQRRCVVIEMAGV